MTTHDHDALVREIRERIGALGFELVDARIGGSTNRPRLQVRLDRADAAPGRGITIEECAIASRALERWLDEAGPLGERYRLEVSSPGVERPVRWREQWQRFVGRDVNVRVPGRGRFRATIVEVGPGDRVRLRPVAGGEEIAVTLDEARDATLAVDWDDSGLRAR